MQQSNQALATRYLQFGPKMAKSYWRGATARPSRKSEILNPKQIQTAQMGF